MAPCWGFLIVPLEITHANKGECVHSSQPRQGRPLGSSPSCGKTDRGMAI